MTYEITLKLPRCAVSQLLDGLYHRARVWEYTVEYLETGYVHEPYEVADCSSPQEAEEVAGYYREIIKSIESQVPSGISERG